MQKAHVVHIICVKFICRPGLRSLDTEVRVRVRDDSLVSGVSVRKYTDSGSTSKLILFEFLKFLVSSLLHNKCQQISIVFILSELESNIFDFTPCLLPMWLTAKYISGYSTYASDCTLVGIVLMHQTVH